MRHTEFWSRMEAHFGSGYAHVWAGRHVLAELEHRTVAQALESGESPKRVWRAVWAHERLPARER